jgi:hypothetical protein
VLRNVSASSVVNQVATAMGTGGNWSAAGVTPTVANAAIAVFGGSATGDGNGGAAWGVVSPLNLAWSTSTGASAGSRSVFRVDRTLIGGANVATGTFALTN